MNGPLMIGFVPRTRPTIKIVSHYVPHVELLRDKDRQSAVELIAAHLRRNSSWTKQLSRMYEPAR